MSQHQIACDFFRVKVYNTTTDNAFTLWIANAADSAYTVFDIGNQVEAWLRAQEIDGFITGISESDKSGFCIVAD